MGSEKLTKSLGACAGGPEGQSASIGTQFRMARERLQLSPLDIARRLRLKQEVVHAIEADDFHGHLPAPVFVKGYLRSYAKLVELPEDEIIQAYNAVQAAHIQKTAPVAVVLPDKKTKEPRKKRDWFRPINLTHRSVRWVSYGIASTLLVLVGVGWYSSSYKVTGGGMSASLERNKEDLAVAEQKKPWPFSTPIDGVWKEKPKTGAFNTPQERLSSSQMPRGAF